MIRVKDPVTLPGTPEVYLLYSQTVRQLDSSSSWFIFCPCGEKVSNEGVPRSRGWVEESLRTIRLSSVSSRRASARRTI